MSLADLIYEGCVATVHLHDSTVDLTLRDHGKGERTSLGILWRSASWSSLIGGRSHPSRLKRDKNLMKSPKKDPHKNCYRTTILNRHWMAILSPSSCRIKSSDAAALLQSILTVSSSHFTYKEWNIGNLLELVAITSWRDSDHDVSNLQLDPSARLFGIRVTRVLIFFQPFVEAHERRPGFS